MTANIFDACNINCYIIMMASSGQNPEIRPADLITEPDAETFAEWNRLYAENSGKFIRLGEVVLVAPGFPDPLLHDPLKHFDIAYHAFDLEDESLRKRVFAASEQNTGEVALRDDGRNLVDAGHWLSSISMQGTLEAMEIWGDSHDFGRADEAGRKKTVQLIKEKLGPDIPVSAET